jgi:hypothetical protein
MLIRGSRIRSIARWFWAAQEGQVLVLGLTQLERFSSRLREVGFAATLNDGDTILPAAQGPVSMFNAEGAYLVHRDMPMETAYRQVEWSWTEWHGQDRIEQSRIVDVPYPRYPRTLIPPPSVEFTVVSDNSGKQLLLTEPIVFGAKTGDRILHTVNLFLELFGECSVLDKDFQLVHQPTLVNLNWTVLPQGKMPWEQLRKELRPIVERQPTGNQPVIQHRLGAIHARGPEFVAVGRGGFYGYVVFAFPQRRLYILECVHFGNATYVFGDDWEKLSQMTKAEILTDRLQKARLIHREGWNKALAALFA